MVDTKSGTRTVCIGSGVALLLVSGATFLRDKSKARRAAAEAKTRATPSTVQLTDPALLYQGHLLTPE